MTREMPIAGFVVRARRVAAHSLSRDPEALASLGRPNFEALLRPGRQVRFRRELPDEELFESLAARVRPVTVMSEPIHHSKVMAALEAAVGDRDLPQHLHETLTGLQRQWDMVDPQNPRMRSYWVQTYTPGEPVPAQPLTDAHLGYGWFYADVAHSDPTGEKKRALELPLKERYAAAVSVWAHIALLVLHTLRLIEELRELGILVLPEECFAESVSVDPDDLVQEGVAYFAPAQEDGSFTMPDIGAELGNNWTPLTITSIIREDEGRRATVRLVGAEGDVVTTYEAAVVRQRDDAAVAVWEILIDEAIVLYVTLPLSEANASEVGLRFELQDGSNQQVAASTAFMLILNQCVGLELERGGRLVGRFAVTSHSTEQQQAAWRVWHEVATDLAEIERLSGTEIAVPDEPLTVTSRVLFRVTRLLLEGHVTYYPTRVVSVSAPIAASTAVRLNPREFAVAGVALSLPTVYLWHPDMTYEPVEEPDLPEQHTGPRMVVPNGQAFLAWAPDLRSDTSLRVTAWGLFDISDPLPPNQTIKQSETSLNEGK